MHGDSSWGSNAPSYVIFGEAGGAAALSAFRFLEDAGVLDTGVQLIAQDTNPEARAFWATLGALTVASLDELPSHVLDKAQAIPCDENLRRSWPEVGCARSSCIFPNATKRDHHAILSERRLTHVKLPKALPRVVVRPVSGSGSKGLIITNPDQLVTEYVAPAREYVIDLDTRTGLVCPRVTHQLRHGADTSVTLININHPQFRRLRDAAWEVAQMLGLSGLCNVQLIEGMDGELWFVEASPRLSGSSRLNLHIGVNLWSGRDDRSIHGPESVVAHVAGIFRDHKGNL